MADPGAAGADCGGPEVMEVRCRDTSERLEKQNMENSNQSELVFL